MKDSDNMSSLPFDDDNVGKEIIYTAEPCEDVEMSECNANVNVSSLDNTSTQSSTWPLLCVEVYVTVGDCFIQHCKHIKTSYLFLQP